MGRRDNWVCVLLVIRIIEVSWVGYTSCRMEVLRLCVICIRTFCLTICVGVCHCNPVCLAIQQPLSADFMILF